LYYYNVKPYTFLFMKTTLFLKVAAAALVFAACSSEENTSTSTDSFKTKSKEDNGAGLAELQAKALENMKQRFYFDAGRERVQFTTKGNVEITIDPRVLTVNGNPVTGPVTVEFIEIFDRGSMAVTDMPTAGLVQVEGMDEEQLAPLVTGGEFLITMTTGEGQSVDDGAPVDIVVPTENTGNGGEQGSDGMIVWEGEEDEEGDDVNWDEKEDEQGNTTDVPVVDGRYEMEILTGQWANIDKLAMFPGEPTQTFVDLPDGYDLTNANVYMSIQGTTNMLFELTGWDPSTQMAFNPYANTPTGQTVNIIFTAQVGGQWLFGIKTVTIMGNDVITFTPADLSTTNNAALIALLNSLP
jgi:hypothetical protein